MIETGNPGEMLVVELVEPQVMRSATRPVPEPRSDEVIVRVEAVGVCGSDVHYFEHGRIGPFVLDAPILLGHEPAGTIVAVGDSVDGTRLGQRVSIEPQRPCRRCAQCKLGAYNLCPDMQFLATPPVDGAFCEYIAVMDDFAHSLPAGLSIEAGALIEPLSVALWAVEKAGVRPGETILVAGAGPIGLLVAKACRLAGAVDVVVSDIDAARRDRAGEWGATSTIDPGEDGQLPEVDVFIDASGAPAAVRAGLQSLARGGRAVLVGAGAEDYELPVATIRRRELVVTGTFRYANTWPRAIQIAAAGLVDLDALVTSRFPLSSAESAVRASRAPEECKVVVVADSTASPDADAIDDGPT